MHVKYHVDHNVIHAVNGVNLKIPEGSTLGLVGESGCGKSSVGKAIIQLEQMDDGKVWLDGKEISCLSVQSFQPYRKHLQMIFQDPYSSLNPKLTVGSTLREAAEVFGVKKNVKEFLADLLHSVGLPVSALERYPHEFSGGQRQRIGIARALAVDPKYIICDEVVSALDVSIQAQILNLMKDLQKEKNIGYLFISHDLAVVRNISQYVAVMYFGKIVEMGTVRDIFEYPLHPYTKLLLSSIPGQEKYVFEDVDANRVLKGPRVWSTYKEIPHLNEVEPGHWVRQYNWMYQ